MKFQVTWLASAERELTELWLAARDRIRIIDAVEGIDADLRANPEQVGESREENHRIVFRQPLGVAFRVFSDDARVVVTRIWRYQ